MVVFFRSLLFTLCILPGSLLASDAVDSASGYEDRLLQTLTAIKQTNLDHALRQSQDFVRTYPNSQVGQLLYADLLMAKAASLSGIGGGSGGIGKPSLADLTLEIKQRLAHEQAQDYRSKLPASLMKLAENQRYYLVIDLSASRLFVFRNQDGTPVLDDDFYISIGLKGIGKQRRGDQKTPVGIYEVTHYIDGKELPDLYGLGAFPINYPNTWDRRQNRTGDGIWLHGTPAATYNRAPWSSDGCVVLSNADLLNIDPYINPQERTPVIITESINWISSSVWHEQQKQLLQTMSRWMSDWESNDHDRYVRHYSPSEFEAYGRDYHRWEGHKRWVNRNKTFVRVEFSNLSIFRYPGEADLVTMQYDQEYASDELKLAAVKELFWRQQAGQWKIVYEGVIDRPMGKTLRAANDVEMQ